MMRSELPWLETRSPWQRFGPTVLGLSIMGLGMAGAVRIVRAQDTVAPRTTPAVVQPAPPAPEAVTIAQAPAATPVPQALPDAPRPPATEDRAASRELDDLLQQRAQLDIRISDLRRRLRSSNRARSTTPSADSLFAPRAGLTPASPEWQRAVDAAQQQAQTALEQAREAIQQAQEALRQSRRAGGKGFYNYNLNRGGLPPAYFQNMPQPPVFNFNGRAMTLPPVPNFQWQGDPLSKQDAEKMKEWQQQFEQQMKEWQPQFEQQMKQWQPQFEQQMKQFEKRMEEWQRSFESQMKQQQLRDRSSRRTQPDDFQTKSRCGRDQSRRQGR
jgi:cell division septum initiation protein DivIVA